MSDPASYNEAMALALGKLRTKSRYEAEVRAFLADFDSNTVERVIRFLKDRRIIDDSKTTQNLIERNSGKRSIGLEKLRAELLERGAPEETVDTLLEPSGDDEPQKMLDLLTSKFSQGTTRAKAARFLFSRGFPEEGIEGVLDRFFQG